jgi:hypothetical protein
MHFVLLIRRLGFIVSLAFFPFDGALYHSLLCQMPTKFNADACYAQIQSINEQIKKLNEEILALRRKVLWGGTKEEKESIPPYLDYLEAE